jgi:hypothetical protein
MKFTGGNSKQGEYARLASAYQWAAGTKLHSLIEREKMESTHESFDSRLATANVPPEGLKHALITPTAVIRPSATFNLLSGRRKQTSYG